ncbi:MAG TPA: hypothetical protein VI588_02360, partial [Candidatus Gracilibacteria bacterium]|nr:hypothetical protein [Candidatus Gracilibacteria bacterium]
MEILSLLLSFLFSLGFSTAVTPGIDSSEPLVTAEYVSPVAITEPEEGYIKVIEGTAGSMTVKEIAQCLGEKGVKFYGAYWCPHCQKQKEMFGDAMSYITYIECDPRGENAQVDQCDAAGVEAFPTWIFPDGQKEVGTQDLE